MFIYVKQWIFIIDIWNCRQKQVSKASVRWRRDDFSLQFPFCVNFEVKAKLQVEEIKVKPSWWIFFCQTKKDATAQSVLLKIPVILTLFKSRAASETASIRNGRGF